MISDQLAGTSESSKDVQNMGEPTNEDLVTIGNGTDHLVTPNVSNGSNEMRSFPVMEIFEAIHRTRTGKASTGTAEELRKR